MKEILSMLSNSATFSNYDDPFNAWYYREILKILPDWEQFAKTNNINLPKDDDEAYTYMRTYYPEAFI